MSVRVVSPGHAVFAVIMIALGVLGLVRGDFTPVWSGVPRSMPAREQIAYLCALLTLASGVALFWSRAAALAARLLLTYFIVWWLLFRLPYVVLAPTSSGSWWECGDSAVMVAGAWALYAMLATDRDRRRPGFPTGATARRIARVLFGLGLIPFGVAHFTYLDRTVSMVPSWLPWHLAWAYLTGGAFIVAGIAMALGRFARLAATLATWQMGLFTVLVWVPIMLGSPSAADWNEFISSCAVTAAGWVVAESLPRDDPDLPIANRPGIE